MGAAAAALLSQLPTSSQAQQETRAMTLLNAPIALSGDWGNMIPNSAKAVVERMRSACLDGVRLTSDRQPAALRVDGRPASQPSIWLHSDEPDVAWIVVAIGERDWSKLAYQFGHELGHVLANSWRRDARTARPSQWVEEALVEAFSLRGLNGLAENWKRQPPFANDHAFGDAIAAYRRTRIDDYAKLAREQRIEPDFSAWFRDHRDGIEAGALSPFAQAASLAVLREYERSPDCIEALGALNRWPGRASLALGDYLRAWRSSCDELAVSSRLPVWLGAEIGAT
jgi:hypothetical protein